MSSAVGEQYSCVTPTCTHDSKHSHGGGGGGGVGGGVGGGGGVVVVVVVAVVDVVVGSFAQLKFVLPLLSALPTLPLIQL